MKKARRVDCCCYMQLRWSCIASLPGWYLESLSPECVWVADRSTGPSGGGGSRGRNQQHGRPRCRLSESLAGHWCAFLCEHFCMARFHSSVRPLYLYLTLAIRSIMTSLSGVRRANNPAVDISLAASGVWLKVLLKRAVLNSPNLRHLPSLSFMA